MINLIRSVAVRWCRSHAVRHKRHGFERITFNIEYKKSLPLWDLTGVYIKKMKALTEAKDIIQVCRLLLRPAIMTEVGQNR